MRLLVWMNAVVALLLVALSVAVFALAYAPGASEVPPRVAENIEKINDIEKLRTLAHGVMNTADAVVRTVNDQIRTGLKAFAALILAFAAVSVANWIAIVRLRLV